MATTVELGAFTGFTLDDPVLGLLDTGILDGGVAFEDVSEFVTTVGVSRGKARDLDTVSAGQLTVSLRNEGRDFDPTQAGPLRGFVFPRKPIRVQVDGEPVFTGVMDDWNFTYSMGGLAVASIDASDGFALLARQENAGGSAVEEGAGARVNRVLDQNTVAWPAGDRDIAAGQSTLEADLLEGNALQYLQLVAESESSLLFISKTGNVTFLNRLIQGEPELTFTDSGAGIPYQDVAVSFGTEEFANRAVVSSEAGVEIAEDTTSQVTFGITERDVTTLLSTSSQLQGLADYIVLRYGVPEFRVERVTVNLNLLDASQREEVLALELGSQADVVFQPPGGGSPVAIRNRVIGISHEVNLSEHFMAFTFEGLPFDFFVLDDDLFGILDGEGVLGF